MRRNDVLSPRGTAVSGGRPRSRPSPKASGPNLLIAGLPASVRMLLGGLAWLLGCFLLVWMLVPPEETTSDTAHMPFALPAPTTEAALSAHADLLHRLDALVAQTLPMALPRARWQRILMPPAGASADPALRDDTAPRRYTVTGPCAPLRLGLALLAAVHRPDFATTARPLPSAAPLAPDVTWTASGTLEIRINGQVSHSFHFPGREGILMDMAQPPTLPALAVVIDDMGQNLEAAQALTALPFPVTLAIWPHAPVAAETASLTEQRRLDSLVHLPMEALPRPNGGRPDPGHGTLLTHMDAHRLALTLEDDLQPLPSAIGLNNHMGSAFTGDADACRRLCTLLAGQGYLVLDSVTVPHAQLASAARKAGLVSIVRDVFLDTRRDTRAVLQALDTAAQTAQRRGWAVAIGHPYGATLAALRAWPDTHGVALVPLRRLVWHWARQQYTLPSNHPNKE